MTTVPQTVYKLRDYQHALVQQVFTEWQRGNRRVMMQLPTGGGKCVDPDTWVWSDGLRRFGDIWGANKIAGPHTTNTVNGWYDDGVRDGFQIETESGWGINGTYAHRIWIRTDDGFEGWRRLDELKIGDFIGLARGRADFGTKQIPLDEAYALGVLVADGCLMSTTSTRVLQIDKQRPLLEAIIPVIERWRQLANGRSNRAVRVMDESENHAVIKMCAPNTIEMLHQKYGLTLTYSQERTVPVSVIEGTKEVVAAFLRGYFDGDGYCDKTIAVSTASRVLAEQVGQMLLGLGVYCRIRTRLATGGLPAHIIQIRDIEAFAREVGFTPYGLTKDKSFTKLLSLVRNTNCDIIPGVGQLIKNASKYIQSKWKRNDAWKHADAYYLYQRQPSYLTLRELVEALPSCAERDALERITREHRAWTKVTDIRPSTIRRIDCEVAESHAFVGNALINHNTQIFSAIAREFTSKSEGVLVLAHREELITQAHEKLEAITGTPSGIIKSGYPVNPLFPVQVASVQTLIRRKNWPYAALVICDEAHHSAAHSYTKIFDCYQQSYILGVTATPARIDGQGFKFLYDALVLGASVAELIQTGHLCNFKLFAAKNSIKTKGVRTTGGDFNQKQLAEAVDASLIMGDLIETWRKYASGKKTVVFAVDVKHSEQVAQAYLEAGIPAEHLDGETPADERKAILDRFRTGETLILSNCGIISEGFDVPSIEAIQCVRPTKSLILWLQMLGRALRPSPGKDRAVIIDHTQNWIFHGLPDDEREWSLEPVSLTSRKWALECPECHHIFKPLSHEQKPVRFQSDIKTRKEKPVFQATCPNCQLLIDFEIGREGEGGFPRVISKDDRAQVEEVNLEPDPLIMAELQQLKEQQELQGYKPSWVYYRLIENYPNVGLPELRKCAELLGFKPGWAWYKYQELEQHRNQLALFNLSEVEVS